MLERTVPLSRCDAVLYVLCCAANIYVYINSERGRGGPI